MNKFGTRLRVLRKERGLSQKELGEKFNLSESAIGMYERGERKPSYDVLDKFSNFFNVNTDYLLGRSDDSKGQAQEYEYDSLSEINKLIKKYGVTDSGFFDIEKWKTIGPEGIRELESYLQELYEFEKKKSERRKRITEEDNN